MALHANSTQHSAKAGPSSTALQAFAGLPGILLAALALSACREEPAAITGPVVCEVAQSTNACLSCQAQRCATELDHCLGAGFHQGRSLPALTARCKWNAETQDYDKDCVYGDHGTQDAASGPTSPACRWMAICLQKCGCGQDCARMCQAPPPDGGHRTEYYANDPREAGCNTCLEKTLAPCTRQHCAAGCPPT